MNEVRKPEYHLYLYLPINHNYRDLYGMQLTVDMVDQAVSMGYDIRTVSREAASFGEFDSFDPTMAS